MIWCVPYEERTATRGINKANTRIKPLLANKPQIPVHPMTLRLQETRQEFPHHPTTQVLPGELLSATVFQSLSGLAQKWWWRWTFWIGEAVEWRLYLKDLGRNTTTVQTQRTIYKSNWVSSSWIFCDTDCDSLHFPGPGLWIPDRSCASLVVIPSPK